MMHLDFETRSAADLKKCGAWQYSKHPSTEVLCASWALDDEDPKIWHSQLEEGDDVDELLEYEGRILAFNSFFEMSIWMNCFIPKYFPHANPRSTPHFWECVAALARAKSLPDSLDAVAQALGLDVQKDKSGRTLMLKLCKGTKNKSKGLFEEPDYLYPGNPEQFKRLGEYCIQDVVVERQIHKAVGELTEWERRIWEVDQTVNMRGFAVDRPLLTKALRFVDEARLTACSDLHSITEGAVSAPSEGARITTWCSTQGVYLSDIQSKTVDEALARPDIPDGVRAVLNIRKEQGLASVAKISTMLDASDEDDYRVRGGLLYFGASRTGRWSGRLVQPQNIVRGFEDQDQVAFVRTCIDKGWTSLVTTKEISNVLRSMFIAAPGHKFIAADYNAIEARVTAIITGAETMLGAFYSGKCPYITMASIIYNVPYERITKEQRFFGKQAVLGLGYGMGAQKFKETCEGYGQETSLEFATQVVSKYRKINKEIPKAWAELDALFKRGSGDFKGIVQFTKGPRVHQMILPSGTPRFYLDPETSDYDASYMGVGTKTRKWERLRTYGGKILENIVQGVARDIQAFAFVSLEDQGFNPILQVHDEIICEVPEDSEKTEADLVRIMETMPDWAEGWPIKAPGSWSGKWFKK